MGDEKRKSLRPRGGAERVPGFILRAEQFVSSNLQEEINLRKMAEAAAISPRRLQDAFRRYRGCTPMRFVRQLRMERVREDLELGRANVTSAALTWGFTHLGRFPSAYAACFGELPSETVSRCRVSRPVADDRSSWTGGHQVAAF